METIAAVEEVGHSAADVARYLGIGRTNVLRSMPIRLAQVIYISPDSDAPARHRTSPGGRCLSPGSDLQHDSEIMPQNANLC